MKHRTYQIAFAVGLLILAWAENRMLGQPPPRPTKPFPVHVTIDATWTDKWVCSHSDDFKCRGCNLSGRLSVTIDGKVASAPNTVAYEPVGTAGARINYLERVYCPIDGEGIREEGKHTAQLCGPSGFATNPNREGHLVLMSVPWGQGFNMLSRHGASAPREGIWQHVHDWDYLLTSWARYQASDKEGHTSDKQVSLVLLVSQVPEKKSGSVSWQLKSADYHDGSSFNIHVVDVAGLAGHLTSEPSLDRSNGVINYTVTWRYGESDYEAKIKTPANNQNFVFGKDEEQGIRIETEAHADPNSYDEKLQPWNIGEVYGSTLEIKKLKGKKESDEKPVKGPQALFRYKKLPESNDSFGYKNITCDKAEPVIVKVFYRKNEHDNPGGKERNWYYYWKQGAVPSLDKFTYFDSSDQSGGYQYPEPGKAGRLMISNLAGEPGDPYHLTLYAANAPNVTRFDPGGYILHSGTEAVAQSLGLISPLTTIYWRRTTSIENCHATVLHEMLHKEFFERFGMFGGGVRGDTDGDGLPDWFEEMSGWHLDPLNPDTHFLRTYDADYAIYGDQELLCRIREKMFAPRKNLDWAYLGSQSDPPEK